jgi:putative MATE family efflux protein
MTVNLVANVVNLGGNAILIWGLFGFPRWGVFGAAVATVFSRLVAAVWFLLLAIKGKRNVRLDLRQRFRPDREILSAIYRVGLPSAGEQLVMRSGQVLFARIVSSLGTVTYAAHQVALNILSLSFQPGMAFATAATTLVGQYLGARRPEDAELCARSSRNMMLGVGVFMGVLFAVAGRSIAFLYTNEQAVIAAAALALRIYAFAQPFQSTQFVLAGGLRGAGDTTYPLYSTALGVWVGRVVVGFLFVRVLHWGLAGAWVSMSLDQAARSVLIWLRFRSGKWKTIRVLRDREEPAGAEAEA